VEKYMYRIFNLSYKNPKIYKLYLIKSFHIEIKINILLYFIKNILQVYINISPTKFTAKTQKVLIKTRRIYLT